MTEPSASYTADCSCCMKTVFLLFLSPSSFQKQFVPPPPLLFRKMSNPDLSPAATAATKSKLHRQLSQDESWGRRSSLAMTGKQLLPLSSSLHAGVSQMAWQGPSGAFIGHGATGGPSAGDGNNLVRMRSQSLGQSAPSLTGLFLIFIAIGIIGIFYTLVM
ncbi:hypothetical protein JOQ06_005882 [Pogonophryne albipinna]|uniref:Uncharacterized protein n=1 Tax=Pogonophryne albipinna TaxID=1090488 RepID=A0AAD6BEL1_9TELE|nr:hypothetical protein JOQ06_005882 [Pogonophryne albipinna]